VSSGKSNHLKHKGELLLFLAALTYGFNGVIAKWVLLAPLSSIRLTEIRTLGASVILGIWLAIKSPKDLKIPRSMWREIAVFGIVGVTAVQVFYFYSISKMPVSIALIIEFTAPIWITLYLRFIKHETVAKSMWYGLGLGFGGLILLAQVWKGLTLSGLGLISSFLDALSLAYYYYKAGQLSKKMSSEAVVFWGMALTAAFLAIVQPWWSYPFHIFTDNIPLTGNFTGHTLPGWALLLWVVVMGTLTPYILVVRGIKHLNASIASTIGMLEPILAGVFAWLMMNEHLNAIQLIGAGVVLVGIYLADRASRSN
jgi:drug/metabolite transporter (DMT)-like permease